MTERDRWNIGKMEERRHDLEMVMTVDQVRWDRHGIETLDNGNRRRTKLLSDLAEQGAVSDGTITPV